MSASLSEKIPTSLELYSLTVRMSQDSKRVSVVIPGVDAQPLEDFLRSAVHFLSLPQIRQQFPHAALPLEASPWLFKDTVKAALQQYKSTYSTAFGQYDSSEALVYNAKNGERIAIAEWGNGAAQLSVALNQSRVALVVRPQEISVEMLIDIFATVLRDPEIGKKFPEFHAPWLNTWGPKAFGTSSLKAEVPQHLIFPTPQQLGQPRVAFTTSPEQPNAPKLKSSIKGAAQSGNTREKVVVPKYSKTVRDELDRIQQSGETVQRPRSSGGGSDAFKRLVADAEQNMKRR